MTSHQLINQTSGDVEYYTDPRIIEAARRVMGRIALDPASSEKANQFVKAEAWFGPEDRSLERGWDAPLWLNHPFGRKEPACPAGCTKKHTHHSIEYFGNAAWINRLVYSHKDRSVDEACCITYACTSEKWFQPLMEFAQCFLCPRTNYYLPDGTIKKGVTKGSVVTYLGQNLKQFVKEFTPFGAVKVKA